MVPEENLFKKQGLYVQVCDNTNTTIWLRDLGTNIGSHLRGLQCFGMWCLRIILQVSVKDKLCNTKIRAKAGMMTEESLIR